jgi:5-methylcytosine-specific restriction endonuclease McrA
MKICWDNLEHLKLNGSGNFQKGKGNIYIYRDACVECGEPYLTIKSSPSDFCCRGCAQTGKRNNMHGIDLAGHNNPMYRHGLYKERKASFATYGNRLSNYEEVWSHDGVLWVKCAYCGKWFEPKLHVVVDRIRFIELGRSFESKFYCSNSCKNACPIFNRKKFPAGYKRATSREVQPELRQIVLKRDNYTCQKCDKSEVELHCHHITGVKQNPIESADIDNCITLCKRCHKEVHNRRGCKYYELTCGGIYES